SPSPRRRARARWWRSPSLRCGCSPDNFGPLRREPAAGASGAPPRSVPLSSAQKRKAPGGALSLYSVTTGGDCCVPRGGLVERRFSIKLTCEYRGEDLNKSLPAPEKVYRSLSDVKLW